MPSHHISAPVSRDSGGPHYAMRGDYEPGSDSRITLSKAEREHAEAAGVSLEEYGRQEAQNDEAQKSESNKRRLTNRRPDRGDLRGQYLQRLPAGCPRGSRKLSPPAGDDDSRAAEQSDQCGRGPGFDMQPGPFIFVL